MAYGIAKKKDGNRIFYKSEDFLKKYVSGRRLALFVIFILFILSLTAFARLELLDKPGITNPYFEALYWIITTMATVGYGDITPISSLGKLLAMFVMVLGVTTLGFLASDIVSSIVSSNLGSLLGINKVRGRIHYLICGWNEVSDAALKELVNHKHRIVILDRERREELSNMTNVHFIKGNPTDRRSLESANIKNTSTVLLCMNNDSDVILAIHVIRDSNPFVNIVAKIDHHENIPLAKNAGADHIVGPATIAGKLLWESYQQPLVANWLINNISTKTNYELFEYDVKKDSKLIGKKLKELRIMLSGKAKIIGIDTASGLERVPKDSYSVSEGNKLILIADNKRFGGLE